MAENDELDSIAAQLQMQQAKGDNIRTQMQQMQSNVIEIGGALEAIKNVKKASKDVLVPIGAGTYLSCPKPDSEKVVINIGANVMLSKKPEEAVKLLEERQKIVGDAVVAAQQDLEQVIKEMDELSHRANLLASGAGRNVRASQE